MESWAAQITAASASQFWWAAAFGVLVVGICTWQTLRRLAHKRLMQNTPTSLVRSAAQGYVELQGHAVLIEGDPIHAALSGEQCVWYRYSVERKERTTNHRGHAQTRWRTVDRGVSGHLFALVDATGSCVIDPDGANVTPSVRNRWYGHSPQPPRLSRAHVWSHFTGLAGLGRTYRYVEERITIGSPLYALGLFRSHAGASPGPAPAEVAALLREWKRDQAALARRFDTDGDGIIDAHEWERARVAATAELSATTRANLPPTVDTLVDTRDGERPFLLSAATEDQLVRRANRQVALFGMLALIGAGLLIWSAAIRLTAP